MRKPPLRPAILSIAFCCILTVLLLSACGKTDRSSTLGHLEAAPSPTQAFPTFTPEAGDADLLPEEVMTLNSLTKVADYPLYSMRFFGAYRQSGVNSFDQWQVSWAKTVIHSLETSPSAWGCSLFAALSDPEALLFGRNFDWEYSPAMLLFTDPPQGYASVSMVDIAYLGSWGNAVTSLTELPLAERKPLLAAPAWPFDGMNAAGLAVGMAAVPPGDMRPDPRKETVDSLEVIREMLDRAGNVSEALEILESYNVDFEGGPPLHYLLADVSGRAVLVEFYQGAMQVIPNELPWHQATNFLVSSVADPEGQCWRYDRIAQQMKRSQGKLSIEEAIGLLGSVSQEGTQWSIVYDLDSREVHVAMGRDYQLVHRLSLSQGAAWSSQSR